MLKGDRGELAVELMTEVGVDTIIPWPAERCVARWRPDREDKALSRWRSSAREAAKQSRRSRFPEITEPQRTADMLARVAGAELALLLDPQAATALTAVPLPGAGEIVVVVGPEGGVSPRESAELTAAGALQARLGPSVLRGSTAGAVAAALVLSGCGRWELPAQGCGPGASGSSGARRAPAAGTRRWRGDLLRRTEARPRNDGPARLRGHARASDRSRVGLEPARGQRRLNRLDGYRADRGRDGRRGWARRCRRRRAGRGARRRRAR